MSNLDLAPDRLTGTLNRWFGQTRPRLSRITDLLASPWAPALVYLLALTAAEALTTLVASRAGMVLHGLVLIALLTHAALTRRKEDHNLLLALALAPLIRLLSLAMPLAHFPLIFWYLIVGIPLPGDFLVVRMAGLKREDIGLRLDYYLPIQLGIGFWVAARPDRVLYPAPGSVDRVAHLADRLVAGLDPAGLHRRA
jgi:hypothetical protein